jgi:hypothetical protein
MMQSPRGDHSLQPEQSGEQADFTQVNGCLGGSLGLQRGIVPQKMRVATINPKGVSQTFARRFPSPGGNGVGDQERRFNFRSLHSGLLSGSQLGQVGFCLIGPYGCHRARSPKIDQLN